MLRKSLRSRSPPDFAFTRSYWTTPPVALSGWLTMTRSRMSIPSSGLAMPPSIPTRSPIQICSREASRLDAVVAADIVPYTPAWSEAITMLCSPIQP